MSWSVALRLGRVSNLPTVWTNVLAALVLAGGSVLTLHTIPILLALSLFYVGGMYLNDAFDAEIDALERPERPIPAGQVSRATVFALGFAMLGGGVLILGAVGLVPAGGTDLLPALGGVLLGAAIVFYDWYHKANPLSPVLMGVCRVLVYITVGWCLAASLPAALLIGAGLLLCYLIGLTYIAKQENLERVENLWPLAFLGAPVVYGVTLIPAEPVLTLFWLIFVLWMLVALRFLVRRKPGDIPRAVVSLIAGIALFDGMLVAGAGAPGLALLAIGGFLLTLALQRYVSGT
jgi:hypothetical protein